MRLIVTTLLLGEAEESGRDVFPGLQTFKQRRQLLAHFRIGTFLDQLYYPIGCHDDQSWRFGDSKDVPTMGRQVTYHGNFDRPRLGQRLDPLVTHGCCRLGTDRLKDHAIVVSELLLHGA